MRGLPARPASVWEAPERIFSDYSYFASYSESWVEHARRFVDAAVRGRLRDEIVEQMGSIRGWGGRFVVPIPRVEVIEP